MFQLSQAPFGRFEKYILKNEFADTQIHFIPAHGSTLLALHLDGQQLLDGCTSLEALAADRWSKNILLYPFPNRLKDGQFEWNGQQYQFPINDGLSENALHGFGANRNFVIDKIVLQSDYAEIGLKEIYKKEQAYFPFEYEFSVNYWLSSKGLFRIQLSMKNIGTEAFPIGLGWHPYWKLSDQIDDLKILTPELQMVGIDQRMIPTGKKYAYGEFAQGKKLGATVLDNCFALPKGNVEAAIHLQGDIGKMRYWQETGVGKFNFLQLYTHPERSSIAIEPMTCNINAFNTGDGLTVLKPGETLQTSAGVDFLKQVLK